MSPADIEQKLRSDIGNAGQRRTDRDGGYPNSRSPRVFQKFGSIPLLTFATVSPQKPTFRIQHYANSPIVKLSPKKGINSNPQPVGWTTVGLGLSFTA
jgi:hypothetical protein